METYRVTECTLTCSLEIRKKGYIFVEHVKNSRFESH